METATVVIPEFGLKQAALSENVIIITNRYEHLVYCSWLSPFTLPIGLQLACFGHLSLPSLIHALTILFSSSPLSSDSVSCFKKEIKR